MYLVDRSNLYFELRLLGSIEEASARADLFQETMAGNSELIL